MLKENIWKSYKTYLKWQQTKKNTKAFYSDHYCNVIVEYDDDPAIKCKAGSWGKTNDYNFYNTL